jgi:hypothetical protein
MTASTGALEMSLILIACLGSEYHGTLRHSREIPSETLMISPDNQASGPSKHNEGNS